MTASPVPGLRDTPLRAGAGSVFVGIDIGASSGRVMAGWIEDGGLRLQQVHRFTNRAAHTAGRLRWDITGLFDHVLHGLAQVASLGCNVASIGIDTWGLDYGLLDADSRLLGQPVSYRDSRTDAIASRTLQRLGPEKTYRINGLQFLPMATMYQLAAEQQDPFWKRAERAMLIPDLLAFWLTGEARSEQTNASTTGLLDAVTGLWSRDLFDALELPPELFPELVKPGQTIGTLTPHIAKRTGLPQHTPVVAVGSHDTASAVLGTPATNPRFAYISCGTWSLVGVERSTPVLTEAARRANFTNEVGVGGKTRFLRDSGGMWALQESMRIWSEGGQAQNLPQLLSAAAAVPPGGPTLSLTDTVYVAPGNMPKRIQAACSGTQRVPTTPAEITRCILDSLATGYARTLEEARSLTGEDIEVIHIVGGGSKNQLLCQLTANASGVTVHAGPAEATAEGNIAVQAQAASALPTDLAELRVTLARNANLTTYQPEPQRRGYF